MSSNGWQRLRVKDVATIHKEQVNPATLTDDPVDLYSIPAFDEGARPQRELASQIKSNKLTIPPDAVLLSKLNPRIPRVWLPEVAVETTSLASTEYLVLQPLQNVDRKFLKYLFLSPDFLHHLQSRVTGTSGSHQRVRLEDALAIEVSLPTASEQQTIVSILGALDDKIELNRRINETLEEMAQAIFKSWFVDFDPVRVKAEEQRSEGMEASLAELFPASFSEVDGNEIPQGWEARPLSSIAHFLNGVASQKYPPESHDQSLPVIKIPELRKGFSESSGKASSAIDQKYIVDDGNVIFSWSGSLELVLWGHGRGVLNQHLFKVTSQEFPKWFYYFWTKQHLLNFRRIAADKATTMGHIQRHHLTEAQVFIPPPVLLNRAHEVIAPMLDKIIGNQLENRTLVALRDTLLPKLISGEIRVAEAERVVGETL